MFRLFCFTLILLQLVQTTYAVDNWPQFRGPSGQGYTTGSQLPTLFSETNGVTWKIPLPGEGWSSPVIIDQQIWLTTAIQEAESTKLTLAAIGVEVASGRVVHQVELFVLEAPEQIHDDNSYASPTPVVKGDIVCCHFGTFGTAAVNRKSGEVVWKNDSLKIEHQGGPGSSPILFEDFVIVTCDGADEQYVAALDISNGEIVWKRPRSAPQRDNPITHRAFATPLLWQQPDRTVLVSPAADQTHAYDPRTGDEIWHVRYTGFSNVPAPVADNEHVYICTGFFEPHLGAIKAGGKGDVTQTHLVWNFNRGVSTIPSPLLVGQRIYLLNESGILTALNSQTGKVIRKHRFSGNYSASPILCGDHIYFCNESGKITVMQANDKLDIVEVNQLEGEFKASPAVQDNSLYLRSASHLYRID